MNADSVKLPVGYYLERDPDLLILHRADSSVVTAFSARGSTAEAVQQAAEEDAYRSVSADSWELPTLVATQPSLRACFFGHFELFCDGQAVRLGHSGKALAILKYLLAHPGRPVSQDYLMGWLWPESNLKRARSSLNSAVHNLRKRLRESLAACVDLILYEDGYYRLNPSVEVSADVDEFAASYERGRRLEGAQRTQEAVLEYEKALELYRDDYLAGDLYEDWTMVERERLLGLYTDILDRLAVHYMVAGRCQDSIRVCHQHLRKDPYHEDSHRVLAECYANLGSHGRASRQYQLFQDLLRSKGKRNAEPLSGERWSPGYRAGRAGGRR